MSSSITLASEFHSPIKILPSEKLKNLQKLNLYSKKMSTNDKSRNDSPFKVVNSASVDPEENEETDRYILALKKEEKDSETNNAKRVDHKLPVTGTTRRQISLNNIEGRKFLMLSSNLEKQLNTTQTQIKRDRSMLLNQYLEAKAVNSNLENSEVFKKDLFETSFNGSFNLGHSMYLDRNVASSYAERSFTERTNAFFSQIPGLSIKDYKNEIKLNEYGKPYKSYLDSITDKFVDQKRTCYPSYLKKTTSSSMSSHDIRKIVDRIKNITEINKKTCSKYRNHKIKQNQAETYNQSKYLVKDFPEITDILNESQQDSNAENKTREEVFKTPTTAKMPTVPKLILKE